MLDVKIQKYLYKVKHRCLDLLLELVVLSDALLYLLTLGFRKSRLSFKFRNTVIEILIQDFPKLTEGREL